MNELEKSDEEDSSNEIIVPPSKRKATPKRSRNWVIRDIPSDLATQRCWQNEMQHKALHEHQTPATLFGLLFDDDVIKLIVSKTELYVRRDKGAHAFATSAEEIRTFLLFF